MKNNLANIKKSKKLLDSGNCVAIPTETVYGLAANAYSNIAVKKIYKLKKRPKYNPAIVHYSNLKMLKNDCILNKKFYLLYKKLCPGPVTFVLKLKKKNKISKYVNNNKNTLAVRFPKNKLTIRLLKLLNYPLAAPSANITKKISSVSAEDVKDEFGKKIKFILDGGRSKIGLESTIISLIKKPQILRLGGTDIKKINKILKINLKFQRNKKKIISPGQSKVHYSPGIPLRLNASNRKSHEAFMLIKYRKCSDKNFYYLSKNKNLKEVAKNLYKTMRTIKNKNYKSIAVEKIPNKGIGLAINDRLLRAAKR
tara:strand:+ start:142 stop:1074 length:933 start_codon:yes stop_codon:yes gene_type:complete